MRSYFRPLRMHTWVGPPTPPHQRRGRHVFKARYTDTINLLDREIAHLGAQEYVIEADFAESDIRLDGLPRTNARGPQFPGVRIAFTSRHGPLVYQADNCTYWQHNIRSVALGLEALRAVDRYGITHRAEQYTGFRAIGSGTPMGSGPVFASPEDAWEFLTSEEVTGIKGAELLSPRALWRLIAKQHHPDVADTGLWPTIDAARQLLEKEGQWA